MTAHRAGGRRQQRLLRQPRRTCASLRATPTTNSAWLLGFALGAPVRSGLLLLLRASPAARLLGVLWRTYRTHAGATPRVPPGLLIIPTALVALLVPALFSPPAGRRRRRLLLLHSSPPPHLTTGGAPPAHCSRRPLHHHHHHHLRAEGAATLLSAPTPAPTPARGPSLAHPPGALPTGSARTLSVPSPQPSCEARTRAHAHRLS